MCCCLCNAVQQIRSYPWICLNTVTLYMISSGLAKLGYTQINIDEGWLLGRYPNGTIYEDLDKFPSGSGYDRVAPW